MFIGESVANQPGLTLHKFSLEKREAEQFASRASQVSVSNDGKKLLFRSSQQWRVVGTARPPQGNAEALRVDLRMRLDRLVEWHQIFDEAGRYERDYFYFLAHSPAFRRIIQERNLGGKRILPAKTTEPCEISVVAVQFALVLDCQRGDDSIGA